MNKQGIIRFSLGCVLVIAMAGCKGCKGKSDTPGAHDDTTGIDARELHDSIVSTGDTTQFAITEANKDSVLSALTKEILTLLKNKDYAQLDTFIHPEEGIRFSPYATVEPRTDKKFSRETFRQLISQDKNKKINWGTYDGSGAPILLTPAQYFGKFVYDGNFLDPKKEGVNTIFGSGNSINNLKTVYQGSEFTENYIDGTPKNAGMDWKSVRLVYKLENGKYYLVGIVHDQWTI